MPALTDGVDQLTDGAKQLADGLKAFDEQGVEKLVEALDGDLKGLMERLNAMAEAAGAYRTFSGLSGDMDGQVKFLYRTEGTKNH
jgi:putative membrane protein